MLHALLFFKEVFSVVFFTHAHLSELPRICHTHEAVCQFVPMPYSLTPGAPSVPMAVSKTVTL